VSIFDNVFESNLVDYSKDFSKSDNVYAIKSWLREHARSSIRRDKLIAYDITDDMKINIKSDCTIILGKQNKTIEEFPEYINFNICKGNFSCSGLGLTTLRGCPKTIYGSFNCSNNKIKDLVGGPITLEKKCSKSIFNRLKEHTKREVTKKDQYENIEYNCSNNQIMLFDGKPKNTKNCKFICAKNPFLGAMMKHLVGKFERGYKITNERSASSIVF